MSLSMHRVRPLSFRGLVHPEDLEQVEKSIHSQIAKNSRGLDCVGYRVVRRDGVISDYTGRKAYAVEYRLLTRDRERRWFQAAGKLSRREDGTSVTYVGIFVDITQQKLTDEALETQRKLLEDALKQTQRAKQARSIFLNNMSHNLRTPMNAITGFTTLAKLSIDDRGAVMDYLEQIMSAANDLQALIGDLLNMSQIESGDVNINEAPCVLPDILIGNALKFTPAGGQIGICLTESQGAPEGYGFYTCRVRDTGIGTEFSISIQFRLAQ